MSPSHTHLTGHHSDSEEAETGAIWGLLHEVADGGNLAAVLFPGSLSPGDGQSVVQEEVEGDGREGCHPAGPANIAARRYEDGAVATGDLGGWVILALYTGVSREESQRDFDYA